MLVFFSSRMERQCCSFKAVNALLFLLRCVLASIVTVLLCSCKSMSYNIITPWALNTTPVKIKEKYLPFLLLWNITDFSQFLIIAWICFSVLVLPTLLFTISNLYALYAYKFMHLDLVVFKYCYTF